ncbi:Signal transduction histidine kinase [Oceanospirillum multiglobuliferum]|uniref:histidine kinase n=1 Tax=Oceanospirillum multiglobuliferum TaxID=64969 RepID=A0A1T4SBH9_9GAMM|nr:hybrid sensor histidine kinase/response regulator [Oceanospirillum multiglobuliferum]OPX55002.1 hybrid sensor histidine kinase/response regulator [Oceanospirillum multiglobuliferum]SKA25258.1 Signal transduction histidine kinase [Oceanospirillum multiglobuliferum]
MNKPSDQQEQLLASLIGLGQQSARKSYYSELTAKLEELEAERNRYKCLNEVLEQRVAERTQALTEVNAQLRQEIAERELMQAELKQAKELAEAATLSKDRYFAAASHDLLQPMNAARLLVSALREQPLPQHEGYLVEQIHLALENAEDLITDLLDISKLDQKAVTPDISEFHLGPLLNSMLAEFQPVAQSKNLKLTLIPNSLAVCSDSRLLLRIIRNLLSNAIRYTRTGRVLIGCRRQGGHIRIEVWDTGDGIPLNQQQNIFKEFQQLDRHRGKDRQGLGLGLAIVERLASMLQHPLTVRSEEGVGSMFSIKVPRASLAALPAAVSHYTISPVSSLHGQSVLVIDNEDSILMSMDQLLSGWGCEVLTASNSCDAIALCTDEDFMPDIILADFHLHDDLLGTDAIQAVREELGQPIPAVIITADRSSECRQLFDRLELPVLNKPVKPSKLRALLSHLVEGR